MYWVLYQTRGEEREQEKGEISPFPALLGERKQAAATTGIPLLPLSSASTVAPDCTSSWSAAVCPLSAAQCRGVKPSAEKRGGRRGKASAEETVNSFQEKNLFVFVLVSNVTLLYLLVLVA